MCAYSTDDCALQSRVKITIAKTIVLFCAYITYTAVRGSDPLTHQSVSLTSQISELAREIDAVDMDRLRKELADDETELAWRQQQIDELQERSDKADKEEFETPELVYEIERAGKMYNAEREENKILRSRLAAMVKELHSTPSHSPAAALRGAAPSERPEYSPGDWVEFDEESPSGESYYMHPGIITNVRCEAASKCLYSVVAVDKGTVKANVSHEDLKPYSPYSPGDAAIGWSGQMGGYVPCTVRGDDREDTSGLMMGLTYTVQFDGSEHDDFVSSKVMYRKILKSEH